MNRSNDVQGQTSKSARLEQEQEQEEEEEQEPDLDDNLTPQQREIQKYIDDHDIRSGVSLYRVLSAIE